MKITHYPQQTASDTYQGGFRSNFPTFPPAPSFPVSSARVTAAQMWPARLLSEPKHQTGATQIPPSKPKLLLESSLSESHGSGLPACGLSISWFSNTHHSATPDTGFRRTGRRFWLCLSEWGNHLGSISLVTLQSCQPLFHLNSSLISVGVKTYQPHKAWVGHKLHPRQFF